MDELSGVTAIASNAYDLSPLVEVLQVVAESYPPERRRKLRDEEA